MQGDFERRPRRRRARPLDVRDPQSRRSRAGAAARAQACRSPATVVEQRGGVEIVVTTEGDIPVPSGSPALFIGGVEVAENERVAGNDMRSS